MRGLVLLLMSLAPTVAFAQAGVSEADDEEARTLFDAGVMAFQNGRFDRALTYFEQAYALSRRTQLLFNIANVEERLRRDESALQHFREYVEAHPDADNAGFARSRIEAIEARLAEGGGDGEQVDRVDPDPPSEGASGGDSAPGIVLLSVGGALLLGAGGTLAWTIVTDDLVSQCNAIIAGGGMCLNGPSVVAERDAALGVTIGLAALGVAGLVTGAILLANAGGGRAEGGDAASGSVACVATPLGVGCAGRF